MNNNASHPDSAAARNSAAARDPDSTIDNSIDRALSTLRDVHPRAGLNTRILTSLEHRAADAPTNLATKRATNPGGPLFHGFIVKGWGIARGSARENGGASHAALWSGTAAAASLIAIASLVILHHHSASVDGSPNSVILSEAAQPYRDAQSKDPDIARGATNSQPFSTTNPRAFTHTRSSRPDRLARPSDTGISDHPIKLSTDPDAQALADLHAPSHPAPPLPLTPQEKLFLRLTRERNATLLAELNPEVRAAHDAAETAAFKTFFPDPPPLKQPGDPE